MTDLVEFLRARLDEDERIARAAIADDCGQDGGFEDAAWLTDGTRRPQFGGAAGEMIRTFAVPARVLREVGAKRQMIDEITDLGHCPGCTGDPTMVGTAHECPTDGARMRMLPLLALPYADHPDYREEWRPRHAGSPE
jgi:hypothetical protein